MKPTIASAVVARGVTDRPPILEATRALGIPDRTVAKLNGISPEAVAAWAAGKRPIPIVRNLALLYLVARLTKRIGATAPPLRNRYARRAQVQRESALAWLQLARDELDEDVRGVYRGEDIDQSMVLGETMVAKLEQT